MTARIIGVFGRLDVPLGLAVSRSSTATPDEAVKLIHFALDQGIRFFDTSGADANDLHAGERLISRALQNWRGPKHEIKVVTKMCMAGSRLLPDGRSDHLRHAVDEILPTLGVDRLFMLQLYVQSRWGLDDEALAVVADLQRAGKVEHVGLCNATTGQLHRARQHFKVAAVQHELSVLRRKNAANGLLALTRELGIAFLADHPLGDQVNVSRLSKDRILVALAQRHQATPQDVALAALLDAGPHVAPIIEPTCVEEVHSYVAATRLSLDVSDRTALALGFPMTADPEVMDAVRRLFLLDRSPGTSEVSKKETSRLLAESSVFVHPASFRFESSARVPSCFGLATAPELVLLMGIHGSGKSHLAEDYMDRGYVRLNPDQFSGRMDRMVHRLRRVLAANKKLIVMDGTFPTRRSRAPIITVAHDYNIPVRCVQLTIPPAEAYFNVALQMIERYGRLLGPEEIEAKRKNDSSLVPPSALKRWIGTFEVPNVVEGFSAVDTIPFVRRINRGHTERGLLLDVDTLRRSKSGTAYPRDADDVELLPGRHEMLLPWVVRGYQLFFVANLATDELAQAEAAMQRTAELLRLPVTEIVYCPHHSRPVACWCRMPLPGMGVYLMERHRLARKHLIVVGGGSDAEFARGIGATYWDARTCFGTQWA